MTRRLTTLSIALLLASGCSLVVEGEVGDLEPNINAKRDVRVTLIDMNPHIGQFNDVAIITPADPDDPVSASQVEARAVLNPLPTGCFELFWPLGASLAATRVDFYADLNMDGMISPPGEDHLWRRELDTVEGGAGEFEFIHDVMFDDIGADPATEPLRDLTVDVSGLEAFEGQLLVVSATRDFRENPDAPTQRSTPAILVVGAVTGGVVQETVRGVLDDGVEYTVDFNFGQGSTLCRGTAVASGPAAVITSIDDFDCDATDPLPVFRDVTSERRCMEP